MEEAKSVMACVSKEEWGGKKMSVNYGQRSCPDAQHRSNRVNPEQENKGAGPHVFDGNLFQ